MARSRGPQLLDVPLPFPLAGLSDRMGYAAQEPMTTVDCQNVRGVDPTTGRLRGGSRPGLSKWLATQPNSSNAIQCLEQVVVSSAVSGASTRTLYGLAVAGGNVYQVTTSAATLATNGSGALSSTSPYVHAAGMFGVVYFADGVSAKYWTASTNTVSGWTASTAGTLPANSTKLPRLITKWRNRIVLSGIEGDGHNWFMSAVDDPYDWDYAPAALTPTMAVAGNGGTANDFGQCPDLITALIPIHDDLLLFGGDHTLYRMTNDPAAGGEIDLLSSITGVAFGKAWCRDPSGTVYFLGSRGDLYRVVGDGFPEPLSDRISRRLANLNLATHKVLLEWDDANRAVMIFVTPTSDTAGMHFVFDVRSGAFWKDVFGANGHQPYSVLTFDGDAPGDRVTVLGCRDGYLRKFSASAKDDDGTAIASHVDLGPLQARGGEPFRLQELDLTLGDQSDAVTYAVRTGRSIEAAYDATARWSGTWTVSRTARERRRATGQALYLRISNSNTNRAWQYESGRATLELLEGVRAFS